MYCQYIRAKNFDEWIENVPPLEKHPQSTIPETIF